MYNLFENKILGNQYKCWYCGVSGFRMTKDHFFPRSLGGRLVVRSCHICNSLKSDKTPLQWIEFVKTSSLQEKERILNASITLADRCEFVYKNGVRQRLIPKDYLKSSL